MKKLEKKQLIVVALAFALLLLIGGTYAYFSINATSDKTGAKVTGKAGSLGNPTLQIKTSKLYLNLDAKLMSQAYAGKVYYANEDQSGLALETNPNYVLATVSLPEGDEALDCTYNYKVTATVTTPITDDSDSNVVVIVGNKTMTLKELTVAGTNGIIVSGEIKKLKKGQSVSIALTSRVSNTYSKQDDLVGNSYTINIEPYTNGDVKAFSCKQGYKIDKTKTIAQNLIDSGWLWQSGLEGDGYRYVGTGEYQCSYNNGEYIITSGAKGCPSWTYDAKSKTVKLDSNGQTKLSTSPDNFICFGTTDKAACTANQDKYMYRVLGVFSDSNGDKHVKLIKYKQLGEYPWNANSETDISWENSDMYKGLNGSYFLTNTTYDYLQNTEWPNKIESWTWSAVNTKRYSNGGTSYYGLTPSEMYLHEMNRAGKTMTGGEWTSPVAKIGLMYASDYTLSLGSKTLAITGSTYENKNLLKKGWVHQINNDTTKDDMEWIIAREGEDTFGGNIGYRISLKGNIDNFSVSTYHGVRPVFYLTSDAIVSSGDGSLENPFIIEN